MTKVKLNQICRSRRIFRCLLVTQTQHYSDLHLCDRVSCHHTPGGYAVLRATISKTFSADIILVPLPKLHLMSGSMRRSQYEFCCRSACPSGFCFPTKLRYSLQPYSTMCLVLPVTRALCCFKDGPV
ncbi:hypothetical protein V8C34DRAFT_20339 [Trichoderma compactum]